MNLHKKAINAIDPEFLAQKEGVINGVFSTLVFPCKGNFIEWTQENKYARSVVMGSVTGDLLSAGFPKFVNLGENPANFPPPDDITDAFIVEKMDGSLCIVDIIGGEINMRTRGTHSYKTLENAKDFEVALAKHPLIEPWLKNHVTLTLLFEIVTPNNRIVIDYPEIDLYLIGAIRKVDYSIVPQTSLDNMAAEMVVKRPPYYTFNNLSDCIKTVKAIEGKEGVCMYMPNGEIFKIKGDQYLKLHYFKSNATSKNMLALYEELDFPSTNEMQDYIVKMFDWECWEYSKEIFYKLVAAKTGVDRVVARLQEFVDANTALSQKEFAAKNIAVHSAPDSKVAFMLRNHSKLPSILYKKRIQTILDNENNT